MRGGFRAFISTSVLLIKLGVRNDFAELEFSKMSSHRKTDALVIIFDTGQTVCQTHFEDGSTFFEKARDCISWILKRKIMSMSKDLVCILLTGTDETGEPIDDLDVSLCENISIKFDFQSASWDMLHYIDNRVKKSDKMSDWVGALAVSIEKFKLLEQSYNVINKTVVIFSDLNYTFKDAIDYSLTNIRELNIEITFIGPDYIPRETSEDNEPYPKKSRLEADFSDLSNEEKIDGKKLLYIMWNELGDLMRISNFDSALRQLSAYSKKTVSANPWNCIMDIGDLKISVQVFKKIDKKMPFRADLKCQKVGHTSEASGSINAVRDKTMYYKHTDSDISQTKEVSVGNEDIISGFRYGTSIIPFSDEDKSILGYKPGKKCFSVLGFTHMDKVPYYILTGECSYIVVPRDKDQKAEVALSAVIQAMAETGYVAIVRRVYSDDRGLSLGVLYPVVEEAVGEELNHKECLVFIELAFDEDIRAIRLPRLRRIKKTISHKQYELIDDLIDEMDLMKVKSGSKGEAYEALDLFSRHEMKDQFFQHCIVHKALYPNNPLPDKLPKHCENYIRQLHSLTNKSGIFNEKLAELFPAKKKLEPSGTSTKTDKSNFDSSNLYKFDSNDEKTAVNCFRRLFREHKYPPVEAINNLLNLSVREFHFNSEDTAKALLQFTRIVRQKTLENFTDDYNYWMRRLRVNLGVEGEVERIYWKGVLEGNLGLITVEEHEDSYTKREDAISFIDSLTSKEESEEEKRKMDVEVDEAINLLF